jgi:hypothetical protein
VIEGGAGDVTSYSLSTLVSGTLGIISSSNKPGSEALAK